jgi:hypothetical protein
MSFLLFALIGVLLFVLAFVTKRRFGVLVLALCAGVVLADVLTTSGIYTLQFLNVSVPNLPSAMLSASILTVAPSLILMIGGPRHNNTTMAIIGSLFYALFALLLLLLPLQSALALGETSGQIVDTALSYKNPLVALIVLLALFDVFGSGSSTFDRRRKH